MTEIDYNQIDPDPEKDPTEYHYTERRAEIWRLIEQAGSPKRLDTMQLADRYGVTRSQIYQDIDRLGEFVSAHLGDRAQLRTQALFERVIDHLLDDGEMVQAWHVVMEWNNWLADRGAIERAPVAAEITHREADRTTEDYELLTDDEAESIELAAPAADGDGNA